MVVGENGILNRATEASKKTKYASEKEAIEFIVSDIKTGLMVGEEIPKSKYLGEELKNRQPGDWKMITVGENAYGTGWYFLEKEKEIDGYGKSSLNWIINYNTGEILKLEDEKFSKLSSSDAVIESCQNNIIFNLDASSIGKATSVEDLESEDVDFIGFEDVNENSGLTENSFKFDGVDDYVKIKYDDSPALNQDGTPYEEEGKQLTKKEVLAKNGFTFEFYGILNKGKAYYNGVEQNSNLAGIFCYWNGDEKRNAEMRFGMFSDGKVVKWNAGSLNSQSELSEASDSAWNQQFTFSNSLYDNKPHYLAVTLDTTKEFKESGYYKHTIYLDGKKLIDAKYNKESWDNFITLLNDLSYFCVARTSWIYNGYWHYSKMDAYTLRLYNRALTDTEVETSYSNSKLLLGIE